MRAGSLEQRKTDHDADRRAAAWECGYAGGSCPKHDYTSSEVSELLYRSVPGITGIKNWMVRRATQSSP